MPLLKLQLARNKPKKRRGLSTIVTSAILLSAVALMGVMVVGWSNSNLSAQQAQMENNFSSNLNKIKETLVFEHVWFTQTPPKTVNIALKNVGEVGLNVTEIKFRDPDGSTLHSEQISNGGIMPKSDHIIPIQYDWTSNQEFDVIIETNRDSIFSTQVMP